MLFNTRKLLAEVSGGNIMLLNIKRQASTYWQFALFLATPGAPNTGKSLSVG